MRIEGYAPGKETVGFGSGSAVLWDAGWVRCLQG